LEQNEPSSPRLTSDFGLIPSKRSNQRRRTFGSLIFAYGKEQRVLVLNPFDEIDRPKVAYTVPEILEPAQFKRLLETAEEEVPELIPFSCNGGLRRRSAE
jgi:site-specific recombinase XerD